MSTNLGRHLVLAAPVLSLGLPTLVLLNMADDLAVRGGEVDVAALSHELGAPVALISASKGTGIDRIQQFLSGTRRESRGRETARVELTGFERRTEVPPVGRPTRQCARRTGLRLPPLWTRRLDAMFSCIRLAGRSFLWPLWWPFSKASFPGRSRSWTAAAYAVASSGQWMGMVLPNRRGAIACS